MRIVVTGSLAYDYLMTFPGKFREHFLSDRMHRLTVSFLVDDMRRLRGGVAGNIAWTLALLGGNPLLIATAGEDFAEYRTGLDRAGVDTSGVTVIPGEFTASCFINTDQDANQIVAFYAGALSHGHRLELGGRGLGPEDLVVISPTDPESMLKAVEACRTARVPYLFDPGKQTPRLEAPADPGRDGVGHGGHRQRLRVRAHVPEDREERGGAPVHRPGDHRHPRRAGLDGAGAREGAGGRAGGSDQGARRPDRRRRRVPRRPGVRDGRGSCRGRWREGSARWRRRTRSRSAGARSTGSRIRSSSHGTARHSGTGTRWPRRWGEGAVGSGGSRARRPVPRGSSCPWWTPLAARRFPERGLPASPAVRGLPRASVHPGGVCHPVAIRVRIFGEVAAALR